MLLSRSDWENHTQSNFFVEYPCIKMKKSTVSRRTLLLFPLFQTLLWCWLQPCQESSGVMYFTGHFEFRMFLYLRNWSGVRMVMLPTHRTMPYWKTVFGENVRVLGNLEKHLFTYVEHGFHQLDWLGFCPGRRMPADTGWLTHSGNFLAMTQNNNSDWSLILRRQEGNCFCNHSFFFSFWDTIP